MLRSRWRHSFLGLRSQALCFFVSHCVCAAVSFCSRAYVACCRLSYVPSLRCCICASYRLTSLLCKIIVSKCMPTTCCMLLAATNPFAKSPHHFSGTTRVSPWELVRLPHQQHYHQQQPGSVPDQHPSMQHGLVTAQAAQPLQGRPSAAHVPHFHTG